MPQGIKLKAFHLGNDLNTLVLKQSVSALFTLRKRFNPSHRFHQFHTSPLAILQGH